MKKVLIILLALLVVTGVVFAADPTPQDDATLTLTSGVAPFFKHGFALSAPEFKGESAAVSDYTASVYMDQETNEVGVYFIETNANTPVNVTFELSPLTNNEGAYVPYELSVLSTGTVTKTGRFSGFDGFSAGGEASNWSQTIIWETKPVINVVTSSAVGGNGTLVIPLNAKFSTSNTDLPEGSYSGTVVAKITTTN